MPEDKPTHLHRNTSPAPTRRRPKKVPDDVPQVYVKLPPELADGSSYTIYCPRTEAKQIGDAIQQFAAEFTPDDLHNGAVAPVVFSLVTMTQAEVDALPDI